MSNMDKDSDEVTEIFCEFCNDRGRRNIPAEGYCTVCVTYFCEICLDHHRVNNRKHKMLDKEDMPKDFCPETCSEHPTMLIKYYCRSCNMFACSKCSSQHRRCWRFYHLIKYVTDFEKSKEFRNFEKSLEALGKDIDDLETALNNSMRKIQYYNSDAKSVIKRQRKEINALFDQMEKEINILETVDKLAVEKDVEKITLLKNKFLTVKSDIENKKMSTSRIKLFTEMKKAIPETENIKGSLQELENDIAKKEIHKYKYEVVTEKLKGEKFGKLTVEKKKVRETDEGQWFGINMW